MLAQEVQRTETGSGGTWRLTPGVRAWAADLEARGLALVGDEKRCRQKLDEAHSRAALREHHGIEIGGGVGQLQGRLWRVGLMGYGARQEFVLDLLGALELLLATHGHPAPAGAGVAAAMAVYSEEAGHGDHGAVG